MFHAKDRQVFVDKLTLSQKRNKAGHRGLVADIRMEPDQVEWPESVAALQQLRSDQLSRVDPENAKKDTIKIQFVREFDRCVYNFTIRDAEDSSVIVANLEFGADVKGAAQFKLVQGVPVLHWKIEMHLTPQEVGEFSQAVGNEYVQVTISRSQVSLPFHADELPGASKKIQVTKVDPANSTAEAQVAEVH